MAMYPGDEGSGPYPRSTTRTKKKANPQNRYNRNKDMKKHKGGYNLVRPRYVISNVILIVNRYYLWFY